MVSHQARALFVHVQKTGGSSLDQVLKAAIPDVERPRGDRHLPLRKILRRYPELADYWTFGFVRNPWARMLSWWLMIQRAERSKAAGEDTIYTRQVTSNPLWCKVLDDYPDFETFILRGTEEIPTLQRPQIAYLRAPGREVDFIGRQESYEQDLHKILDHLGVHWPDSVPRENAGPDRDYRDYYTPKTRRRVREVFRRDLRRFGYTY